MRSPPRKSTASGSSKSSFHSKTPDGAGTSPAPPFSFPAPQQKAGIPGEAKEDILSVPTGGHSHVRARGRSLWRKGPSPLDPHPKHGGRHRPPCPLWHKGRGLRPSPFGNPLPKGRGTRARPPLWKPTPKGRETRDGGAAVERGAEGVLFAAQCAPHLQMRGRTDLRIGYSAAGRRLLDLVGSP